MSVKVINLVKPVKPRTPNEYDGHIAEIVKSIEAGEGNAAELTVPTAEASTKRRLFGLAARDAGKTARTYSVSEDEKTETTTFVIEIVKAYAPKPRTGGTVDTGADAVEDDGPVDPSALPEDDGPVAK